MVKTWKITLNSPWFEYVRENKKTYEGRCYWKNVKEYSVGDILVISHHTCTEEQTFVRKIVAIHIFKTFEEALEVIELKQVLPGVNNIADGLNIYKQFVSIATQEKYGVCMIELSG